MKVLVIGIEKYICKSLMTNTIKEFDEIKILTSREFMNLSFIVTMEKYRDYDVIVIGIDKSLISLQYDFKIQYEILNNINYFINNNSNLKKVVFISSYGVYKYKENASINENDELYTYDYLGSLFLLYENMLRNACDLNNKKLVILRLFNIFSVFQDSRYIVKNVIEQIFNSSENLVLGDSRKKRDYVYIKDFINLLNIVIKKDFDEKYNVYNVGSGKSTSIKELVDIVKKITGIDKNLIFNPEKIRSKYDFSDIKADMSKVKTELGYEALYSLEDGLREIVGLYKFKEII